MKIKRKPLTGTVWLGAFTVWTVLIRSVDVENVGVNGTAIGFAAVNTWFFKWTGVHMTVYTITDWLDLFPYYESKGCEVKALAGYIA